MTFYLEMKKLGVVIIFAIATLVVGNLVFGSHPVKSKPERTAVVGQWECSDLPQGFVQQVGEAAEDLVCTLVIREDGSLSASNFPQRSPYRLVDIESAWRLSDPSMTPSGSWSVSFGEGHLQCRERFGNLILSYSISGKDSYYAKFQRK